MGKKYFYEKEMAEIHHDLQKRCLHYENMMFPDKIKESWQNFFKKAENKLPENWLEAIDSVQRNPVLPAAEKVEIQKEFYKNAIGEGNEVSESFLQRYREFLRIFGTLQENLWVDLEIYKQQKKLFQIYLLEQQKKQKQTDKKNEKRKEKRKRGKETAPDAAGDEPPNKKQKLSEKKVQEKRTAPKPPRENARKSKPEAESLPSNLIEPEGMETDTSKVDSGVVPSSAGDAQPLQPLVPAENTKSVIYVRNLPWKKPDGSPMSVEDTQALLQSAFSSFGEIKTIRVVKNSEDKLTGFAFIEFTQPSAGIFPPFSFFHSFSTPLPLPLPLSLQHKQRSASTKAGLEKETLLLNLPIHLMNISVAVRMNIPNPLQKQTTRIETQSLFPICLSKLLTTNSLDSLKG